MRLQDTLSCSAARRGGQLSVSESARRLAYSSDLKLDIKSHRVGFNKDFEAYRDGKQNPRHNPES